MSDQKKRSRIIDSLKQQKKKLIICGGIILAFVAIYGIGTFYYNDKYLPGTQINEIDVGGLTVTQANETLSKRIQEHQLELTFNDGAVESIASDNLGLQFHEDNSIGDVLKQQSSWNWIAALFNEKNYNVNDVILINDEALSQGLNALTHLQADQQVAPTDAYIQYSEGAFTIVPETKGATIQYDALLSAMKTALSNGTSAINVEEVGGYVAPSVLSDSQDLNNKLEAANTYCTSSISYTTPSGKSFVLDGSTMLDWLTKNDDGTYTRDDSVFKANILTFVKKLANSYNTSGETRTFRGTDGVDHTVSGGTYGIRIMPETETAEVLELIQNNQSVENRTPRTTGLSASDTNGGLGTTYVEVSITQQHLWYYKDGAIVLESDFVSGKETDPERITPSGTYYVYFKQRNRVLRGTKKPDGTWPYETPVKYWMAFNKGIGFHDLNRSRYGGDVYLTNGSHGCINLPESFAASLYASLSENTPVVVYR